MSTPTPPNKEEREFNELSVLLSDNGFDSQDIKDIIKCIKATCPSVGVDWYKIIEPYFRNNLNGGKEHIKGLCAYLTETFKLGQGEGEKNSGDKEEPVLGEGWERGIKWAKYHGYTKSTEGK